MLIEEADENLIKLIERVNEESRKEKGDVPALSKMLFYATRKPLIASRAVILASVLRKGEDHMKSINV